MNEVDPQRRSDAKRKAKPRQPSRKLNFVSRVRGNFRRALDQVLSADPAWSVAFVVIVMLLLGSQNCSREYENYEVGDLAPRDIKARYDIDVADETLTAELRRQAREEVPDVYLHDGERRLQLARDLTSVFDDGRKSQEEAELAGAADAGGAVIARLSPRVPVDALQVLLEHRFDPELERAVTAALTAVMDGLIVANKPLLEREPAIVLMSMPGERARKIERYDAIVDVSDARRALRQGLADLPLPEDQREPLVSFVASFVDANIHLDTATTTRRREAAARAVPPVLVRVARGNVLIKRGEPFTAEALARLAAARRNGDRPLGLRDFLGLLLIVGTFAFFIARYSRYHQRAFRKLAHLHALMVLMLLSMLLLAQAVLWLAGEVIDSLDYPFNQLGPYQYLIPLGAGSILIALLANGRIAMVYAAFASVLFGVMNGWDLYLAVWATVVQYSGIYAISTYSERAALIRAGLVVGGFGAVSALAVETLRGDLEPYARSLYGAGLAFIGGAVGVGLLVSFTLPLLERLFDVLTDIRLLELSHANHPLLSQLAITAPGSYNHSLVVGTLAQEGANAIGANGLYCRVAAFYHDIGKMNHAEYFVENQRGTNPHDRLSPSMSALVIASHVKDGIRMAREAGLPHQITDIIPQHHGTRKMTFFYEKAKSSADPSTGSPSEADFRYPGPKPQTREAAIFMLADAVEAAARTVDDPTPNRLGDVIRKVSHSIVLDGQFDECDLTFADLERVQQAFLRLLVSMYHQRVDYPGFDFRRPKATAKESGPGADRKAERGS